MAALQPFKLERYFAQHEFSARYLLSASDCETLSVAELLALADDDGRRRWDTLRLGYTESQGDPALRAAAAAQYDTIDPDQVLVAAPEELIFIAMQTLLEPGQHVICIQPAYQSLYEVARSRGIEVSAWPVELAPSGDAWRLDLDRLASLIRPDTRLLVINFPHNPTGFVPDRSLLNGILEIARQHELIVFSDEMYRGLEHEPERRLPAVCDIYERGISLSGMSKALALPGLRLGWLATRASDLLPDWMEYKDYTTICSSAPSEVLALIGLRASRQLLDRSRAIVAGNLAAARAAFATVPNHLQWVAPTGGSIAFPAWTGPGSVEAFCRAALERESVMIVPGSIFDFPGAHFRLGLGRRNFREALARALSVAAAL
jgi:aspartate/methionine/tyrosine aminotransferase